MAWIEPGGDPPAARLARAAGQFAAERADALGHPGPPPGARVRRLPTSSSSTSTLTSAGASRRRTAALHPWACVLHRVRQGFLDEPETTSSTPGGVFRGRTAAFVPDRQPGRPDPGEQAFEVGPPGRFAELKAVLGWQDAKQAAGFGEGLPGGARHASDRFRGLGGGAGDRGQGAVGKRHDDGEVVSNAVHAVSRAIKGARPPPPARALVWSCSRSSRWAARGLRQS